MLADSGIFLGDFGAIDKALQKETDKVDDDSESLEDWLAGVGYGNYGNYSHSVVEIDSHFREPVKLGEYTVLASSKRGLSKVLKTVHEIKPYPDIAVYLDKSIAWDLVPFVERGLEPITQWPWPFILCDWPDMNVMRESEQTVLLDYLVEKIKDGNSIEISCYGGHGRTGTLIAMLWVRLTGIGAKDAIDGIRDNYCKRSIESDRQEDAIYRVAGEKPPYRAPPPKPTYAPYTPSTSSTPSPGIVKASTGQTSLPELPYGIVKKDPVIYKALHGGATRCPSTSAEIKAKWPNDPCECGHNRTMHLETGHCVNCRCDWFRFVGVQAIKNMRGGGK